MPRHIAYYRVSTDKQGKSGLGLDAQRAAVAAFIGAGGLLEEFVEVETGKGSNALERRPELYNALELCRKEKAVLVIAKLDRLARNVHFIAGLMESSVEFVAVDMPQANRLTIHILAAVAEHEREMISQRTKAALGAAKARGIRLGSPTPSIGSRAGVKVRCARAKQRAASVFPIVEDLKARGVCSLRGLADALNNRGIRAPQGGLWHAASVSRLISTMGP
jgi:DNA invertase Pin-like site-specific DNA recombinase